MTISNRLLDELSTWPIVSVPDRFYHGCCFGDQGVDVCANVITGNKWFSIDRYYAGEYAWHFSRPENAQRMRLELELTHPHLAVSQPTYIDGENWPPFLAKCFPGVVGYDLSREFHNSLESHLSALGNPDLKSYYSNKGREICIPSVERYVRIVSVIGLPHDKARYKALKI
ncbi:hypothetical protein [Pseudomonas syringae]|uniref:hypothetical protein n=1 Tax=Pseudomonas syringae TaxID=317 RepID=UPI000A25CBD4|nr:hypothetical protein [Pseudomonas syringae]OSR80858.1 hypothetical protein BV328_00772 [Pseudomonas syringae pv. actinidiae]